MSYNFLKDARTVKNSELCLHDNLDGYSSDFHTNGNVDGWDIYDNIYLYGCWNSILFGTAYDRECYISRSNVFQIVEAEDYYYVRIMMKITDNNPNASVDTLTTGRIQWTRLGDDNWTDDKQLDFDIVADNKWRLYTINMGPAQWWQGNINNMRVYPFIDAKEKDQFAIKFIKISSLATYACSNTQCSYYTQYTHPCPGAGLKGMCEAGAAKTSYTTISGVNDGLIVDINGYGTEYFSLGNNINLNGISMAKVISNKISALNIGGYNYAFCEYSDFGKLKITSGSTGINSLVTISGAAAEALGFYDGSEDISIKTIGTAPATGFDYASSRILTALEINRLMDGNSDDFAYIHNPSQYSVEGGRRDFNEMGTAQLLDTATPQYADGTYYADLDNKGRTLIDFSHPINNNGRITSVYMYGIVDTLSKVKVLRPRKDGSLLVVHSLNLPSENSSYIYTVNPTVYRLDCNILVEKGDLLGIYNANLYVGVSPTGLPGATFVQMDGDVSGTVIPGDPLSFGVGGFAIYARGDRWQTNTILDIDLGDRLNIEEMNIYGKEESEYFEFNIASCEDVAWEVDLFGGNHRHYIELIVDSRIDTHQNIAYGLDSLDDCIITADNGQVGTSYGRNSNGLWTGGGEHSYFYVNGDAEWLYQYDCSDSKYEYCGNEHAVSTMNFVNDPIALTLKFPYEYEADIHKSIIYFKERNNFRSIALSYYLGKYNSSGNADDNRFRYIPSYTSVALDGLVHESGGGKAADPYIFSNPTNPKPIYYGPNQSDPINWQEVEAASGADWTILEHTFEPIVCKGFRVYTNYHNSTKITEMEVYSRLKTNPSLLDNVTLSFSDYGDLWTSVGFEEITNGQINAFIGGAPRYFRLEFDSATKFSLNEIEMVVGDQVKTAQCDDIVLLEHSKSEATNEASAITIENIYDKPFDLSIDLPKEVSEVDDVVFWSKLGAYDEIYEPEVGPGCKLYKQDDYPILNDNRQCAINVPAYALKNLVDGKKAYYAYREDDWQEFGTLSSGTSIDFSNSGRELVRKSEFEFISLYSATYWKVECNSTDPSDRGNIMDIFAYNNDELLEIDKIYYASTTGASSQSNSINSNGVDIDINDYNDDFTGANGDPPDSSKWNTHLTTHGSIYISNNKLHMKVLKATGEKPYITPKAGLMRGDFDVQINLNNLTGGDYFIYSMFFYIDSNNYVYTNFNVYGGRWYIYIEGYANGSRVGYRQIQIYSDYFGAFRLVKKGSTITGYVRLGGGTGWTYSKSVTHSNFLNSGEIRIQTQGGYPGATGGSAYAEVNFDDFIINYGLMSLYACGFKLKNGDEPIDKIKIYHTSSTLTDVSVRASPDNSNNYVLADDNVTGSLTIPTNNQNYNTYLAIDLEKRHDIGLIRNYGNSTNKVWMSISSAVGYSNTDSSNILDVVVDNSTKDDARWLICELFCGDGTTRYVRKLGIYPDISSVFCHGGGYNCEWQELGTILSDYTDPLNVAYGATTTGTNYYFSIFYPDNAVDGISTNYTTSACWGFQEVDSVDPYLELEFDQLYLINKTILFHGYDPEDSSFINTSYTFSVSTTTSGSFTDVFSISGNTKHKRVHQFDPIYARRVRLTITGYDSESQTLGFDEDTGRYIVFNGCYLREMEVYTYIDTGYVDSETWPIVCMNLQDQFNITGHDVVNKDVTDTNTDWDNGEEFFMYSDDVLDDPQKVSFTQEGAYRTDYQKTDTFTTQYGGVMEYLFNTAEGTYFYEGKYFVEWDAYAYADLYNADHPSDEKISLRLDGLATVEYFADIIASATWIHETGSIDIPKAGFYTVKGIQHIGADYGWGVRNPIIYRSVGLRKWIVAKRDTAENYAYDGDSGKYGADYLSLVKVYGDEKYNPLEYSWWWSSTLSDLENDPFKVKTSAKSLKISYPTSSGIDVVSFIEGDNFGSDTFFESKDMLHFWWYIDDVNKLNVDYGDITFGIINSANPAYYMWDISGTNLITGWNEMKLKFEDASYFYPALENYYALSDYISEKLDFRNNGRDLASFRLRYRGKGQAFTMNIEDLKIERNVFKDDVKFGKGLCLTGYDYLEIPLSNLTLEKGTIEFWAKLYTDTYGRNKYGDFNSRVLFSLVNNNNDIISLGIKSGSWFEPLSGHVRKALNIFDISNNDLPTSAFHDINEVIHLAMVWSNDGRFTDNGDTLRFYINGELICRSAVMWDVEDTKSAILKLGGATAQMALNKDAYGSAIFNNVKVYNYCKSGFNIEQEGISKEISYTPNEFLEVSANNVYFYSVGSVNLPLIYQAVPAGEARTIYVRSNKNENFAQSKKTATLIIDWLTTV